jgi:rhamnosyltransferase
MFYWGNVMNGKVAIGIITYNPDRNVLQRLKKTMNCGFKVYIFDNSPDNAIIRDYVNSTTDSSRITYLTCGKNVGLGYGLSALCSHAYYDSFPTLVFFDQDTAYSDDTLQYISNFYSKNNGLAETYSAIAFNSKDINMPASEGSNILNVRLIMNSGSLFFLDNVKKMNWHNTKYFVDCVDYEFCLKSSNCHFNIGEHRFTPGFDHCSEQRDQLLKIFGREYPVRAYPHSRVRDFVFASSKLIVKSIATGNGMFFLEISKASGKYLFIQVYVRIVNLFRRSGKSTSNT